MIKNETQYKVTKTQLLKFEEALTEMTKPEIIANQENALLHQLYVDAFHSQIDELKEDIQNYLARIRTRQSYKVRTGINDKVTIENPTKQPSLQIQRHEVADFYSAGSYRIIQVSQKLKPLRTRKKLKSSTGWASPIKLYVLQEQKVSPREPNLH